MLSPYRGVMHSVVTGWADAVTIDGRNWTLYVRGECLYDDLRDLQEQAISVPDVKYGTWSEKTGFQRAPIRLPTFDARVREQGARLLAAVEQHAVDLPFPLADRFERWLLNARNGLPLALIASSCEPEVCENTNDTRWTPGQTCMAEMPEAQALCAAITGLAGSTPRARWYERHADGSGTPNGARGEPGDSSPEPLAASCFDPLLVDAGALDADQAALLAALHDWQAPALLQLPTLSDAQRARLEIAACAQALRLAEQLPLYPRVLDRQAITAALVEARLRGSQTTGASPAGDACSMSPDYIEIPDD